LQYVEANLCDLEENDISLVYELAEFRLQLSRAFQYDTVQVDHHALEGLEENPIGHDKYLSNVIDILV
jgi:hypothetical protein